MSKPVALKPCPFCGEREPTVRRRSDKRHWPGYHIHRIACSHCGSASDYWCRKSDATRAWNRRAGGQKG